MTRVKNGKVEINRCLYKDIKKFDRATMENFLQDLYQQGVNDGKSKAKSFNIFDFINQCCVQLVMTKGFGIKKTDTAKEVLLAVAEEMKLCEQGKAD